jgi:hypothetical protein
MDPLEVQVAEIRQISLATQQDVAELKSTVQNIDHAIRGNDRIGLATRMDREERFTKATLYCLGIVTTAVIAIVIQQVALVLGF